MKYTNRLVHEKSPYLLQHAHNPVDWFPWGPEAFEKAREEDKPVFLSIGYSTCHWCHVMEKESFDDPDAGRLMNEVFVSIKVDREERPDIDQTYMSVCRMISASCGWPLNIIMTPDKNPFFAGTYFPKEDRLGTIGLLGLTNRVRDLWKTQREELLNSAARVTEALRQPIGEEPGAELGAADLDAAFNELVLLFDRENGGFGGAPKFPIPQNILFLLRYWKRTGHKSALSMAEATLKAMKNGGIYDHIGYGFHRYSTDARWLVPHFEKMLYDQALLSMAYTEAYQAFGMEEYRKTAEEIFTYVLRDMSGPEGGFSSAEDADSEGEEGKFYLWTEEDLDRILGKEDADFFKKVFNTEKEGNFTETAPGSRTRGGNILHLKAESGEIAGVMNMPADIMKKRLEAAREKVFIAREKRVHPHKDDKILTDWNGLMIAALAKGAQAFDRTDYAEAARRAADFILNRMRQPDGRLLHRFRDGEAAVTAYADDYAFLIWGLIELYEATFVVSYLKAAFDLNAIFIRHFWDDGHDGFYFTADDGEFLFGARNKEIYDGAVPSGNSAAMLNLLRLARISGDPDLEKRASRMARAFSPAIRQNPSSYCQLMAAVDFAVGPSYEVVIAGDPRAADTAAMLRSLRKTYLPDKVVLLRPIHPEKEKQADITGIAGFTRDQISINGKATAYICRGYQCRQPTTDISEMNELLEQKRKAA